MWTLILAHEPTRSTGKGQVVKEQETSPSPSQHRLVAALAARRQQADGLWERAKHTWPVEWWAELQALGFVRSCFQFAGMFVLSFLPFLLIVSAVLNRNLPQALVTRSGFSQQAAQDVTSLFARSGTGAVSQSIIGVIFVLAGGDSVASTLQDWYGRVFGEDVPTWRGIGRRFWWLSGVVGFIALQFVIGRHLGPAAGTVLTGFVQFILAVLFWWWSLHGLLAARVPWRKLVVGGVATAALYTAVGVYFSWIAAGSIVSSEHAYGPVGTMMALFETLVGLGLAVHLGAVIGARYGATSPTAFGMKRRS
jgi:membrane protein